MPEAAVDEDGEPLAWKDDIRHTPRLRYDLIPNTVAQPTPMKLAAKEHFCPRILLAGSPETT